MDRPLGNLVDRVHHHPFISLSMELLNRFPEGPIQRKIKRNQLIIYFWFDSIIWKDLVFKNSGTLLSIKFLWCAYLEVFDPTGLTPPWGQLNPHKSTPWKSRVCFDFIYYYYYLNLATSLQRLIGWLIILIELLWFGLVFLDFCVVMLSLDTNEILLCFSSKKWFAPLSLPLFEICSMQRVGNFSPTTTHTQTHK